MTNHDLVLTMLQDKCSVDEILEELEWNMKPLWKRIVLRVLFL